MEELLTIDQLAEYLKVSKNTLYAWTCGKKIPFIKIGGILRFRVAEVLAFLEASSVRPR
jgi:excisionase family DNA binding protein